MKIAIDARSLRAGGGGVSLRMFRTLQHVMANTDHSVVLFCPKNLTHEAMGFNEKYRARLTFVNLDVVGIGPSRDDYDVDMNVIPRLVAEYQPDLLHACANWGISSPEIDVPTLLTVHDLIPFFVREAAYRNDEFFGLYKELIETSVAHADRIVTVSEYSKQAVVDMFGVQDDRIEVVYNGMDTDATPENYLDKYDDFLDSKDLSQGKYIVYVGGFYERKNVIRLVHAFKAFLTQFPDYKLAVTGEGQGSDYVRGQFARFEEARSDIADSVKYMGYVSREHLNALIANARCLVYPSINEGFGIPILEAMALGVPALCSGNTVLPEVGQDAAVYFDPFDTDAITNAMVDVVQDESLRQKKIALGFKRAKDFSWLDTCTRVTRIYESLGAAE